MVFFNCCTCGNGVKKQQIEKHLSQCRSNAFSCVDCGKDFYGKEYQTHIKCITESEKYESKTSYVAKANKGELKQNAWYEKVIDIIENSNPPPRVKQLLQKIKDYPNIPRKKAKFINFVRNSFRSLGINDKIIEETWDLIESSDKKEKQQQEQQQQNGNNNNKRKLDDENNTQNDLNENSNNKKTKSDENNDENGNNLEETKFNWLENIKNIVENQENNEIKYKKLEKKDGILFGQIYNDVERVISDQQDEVVNEKLIVNCVSFLPIKNSYMFYDTVGNLNVDLITKWSNLSDYQIIGWYKCRPNTPNSILNVLEKCVCLNISKLNKDVSKCVFILNTYDGDVDATDIYKNQHQLFVCDSILNEINVTPFTIKNIGASLSNTQSFKYVNSTKFTTTKSKRGETDKLGESININLNKIIDNVDNTVNTLKFDLNSTIDKLIKQELLINNYLKQTYTKNQAKTTTNLAINNNNNNNNDDLYIIDDNDNKSDNNLIPPSYDSLMSNTQNSFH